MSQCVSKISLERGCDFWDYPRDIWQHYQFIISFPTVMGRFIKITQLGISKEKYWSISELRIFK